MNVEFFLFSLICFCCVYALACCVFCMCDTSHRRGQVLYRLHR